MNATTVAIDLAKSVFEVAVADQNWRVVDRARLSRPQFERWFHNRAVGLVVMEACGSAHFWARNLQGLGIEVKLLPPRYVRAYVKRNKTDAADAAALLEAARCADIVPVRVKSVEQQALQGLTPRRRTGALEALTAARAGGLSALHPHCRCRRVREREPRTLLRSIPAHRPCLGGARDTRAGRFIRTLSTPRSGSA
jgi:transposase